MFCPFVGMTSLMLNLKFSNFVTLLKLIKTPQNFVPVSFYTKLTKICHKNMDEFFVSGPLSPNVLGVNFLMHFV